MSAFAARVAAVVPCKDEGERIAATVAAVKAVRAAVERKKPTRVIRRGGKSEGILASRSFLIDVHVLDR